MNTQVRDFRNNFSGCTEDAPLATVKVGDYVGFKYDVEQGGQIVKIVRGRYGNADELHLYNEYGFEGHYARGTKNLVMMALDCWID